MHEAPIPTTLQLGQVSTLAEKMAQTLQFSPGDDLFELVEKLGGRIEVKDFFAPGADTGSIEVRGFGDFDIYVPAHTSSERLRFTVAHEFGHYVLHYLWAIENQGRKFAAPMRASRYGTSNIEQEANHFAASLLMPAQAFRSAFEKHHRDLPKLADLFKVSVGTVKARAEGLGLLKDETK